jgi:hypothetical protein
MRNETLELLAKVRDAGLLERIGHPVNDATVSQVFSWPDALRYNEQSEWYNTAAVDFRNDFARVFYRVFTDEPSPWNPTVKKIRTIVDPLFDLRMRPLAIQHNLPEDVYSISRIIVVLACMELEFPAIECKKVYTMLLGWLLQGHYPCGWEGEYPAGHLVVF